ncbi:MAG: hypothetical protein ABI402_11775 [Ferruginibacter sp.]
MKPNKIIVYDDTCPLCAAYTQGFVSAGMIEKENRKNFTSIDPSLLELLDKKRCPNEIPVIDFETKEVLYGIDAITSILQTRVPFIKKTVQLKYINWPLHKIYKLISYNRKVIVASKTIACNFDCTPDFNYKYRLVFMLLFSLFNIIMLFPIQAQILHNSFVSISINQLLIANLLLIILNIFIAGFLNIKISFEYLGQMNMIVLTSIILTIPVIFLNKYHLIQSSCFNNTFLILLIFFIFKEYKRRMDFAGITKSYRLIHLINITAIWSFIVYLIY